MTFIKQEGLYDLTLVPKRGIIPAVTTKALLWRSNARFGHPVRLFFVRKVEGEDNKYHVRVIVGNTTTTNDDNLTKDAVKRAARSLYNFAIYDRDLDQLR
jgi:hypothetical protein